MRSKKPFKPHSKLKCSSTQLNCLRVSFFLAGYSIIHLTYCYSTKQAIFYSILFLRISFYPPYTSCFEQLELSFSYPCYKYSLDIFKIIVMAKRNKLAVFSVVALGMMFFAEQNKACTRAVYLGPDDMIVTGRTMDWKEDPQSNIYLFPRGMEKRGGVTDNTVTWTSKYGSVVTAGYDIGVCDGMNEKGLVANLLFLTESSYHRPNDSRPVMGLSIWTQYVLDNFATVDEAVNELSLETFRIDDPDLPNGAKSTLHLSISDATGNSAIFEYINGNLIIHEGRECQIMTNSPTYDKQLTLNDYWKEIGGLVMLPGTNRASDRFVRASFYIQALPQTDNFRQAVAGVFSVMRNVSVPLGISIPEQPNIASTRWRTVADQKNKVYYFESTLSPDIFWINFKDLNFKTGAPVKKLTLTGREIYAGNAAGRFQAGKSLHFLFGI